MSFPTDLFSSLPPEPTGDDAGKAPATTVSGPAPHEGAHSFVPPHNRSLPPLLMIYGTGPSKTMVCNGLLT